jgi:AraC-like DNA-binding protein
VHKACTPARFDHNRAVYHWRLTRDPKTDLERHAVARGFGHALLAPIVSSVFQSLRVSAALWEHGLEWKGIHLEASVVSFELAHGKGKDRYAYNQQQFDLVLRHKKTARGERAGLCDFFVPILARGHVVAILVVGPLALAPPTSAGILERWHWLTGRQAHPADPEFASYLSATLSTLVLDGGKAQVFQRLLRCLARLMAGEGSADQLANQAEALRAEIDGARSDDRMWASVREMVDDRSSLVWQGMAHATALRRLGLSRVPDGVLVALSVSRTPGVDPVDEAVRRHAFQRSAVPLARKAGDLLAGQVGDHGVVFLSSASGSLQRRKQKLLDVSVGAEAIARRSFGLALHFGMSLATTPTPPSRTYLAALGAAESALVQGTRIVVAEPGKGRPAQSLRHLRRELGRIVQMRPDLLGPRFDRYLELVAAECGYRMEPAHGHLEAAFERMAEPLLGNGTLDEKSFGALCEVLDRSATDARTISDLFAAYRSAVRDVSRAVEKPARARQDRSLRRGMDYIHQHYGERLRLETIARVAGFAPDYFSKLFKERERTTFEDYVCGLRVERAKQLLTSTDLDASRVSELCGFGTPQYFSRVFRSETGSTPRAYRQDALATPRRVHREKISKISAEDKPRARPPR